MTRYIRGSDGKQMRKRDWVRLANERGDDLVRLRADLAKERERTVAALNKLDDERASAAVMEKDLLALISGLSAVHRVRNLDYYHRPGSVSIGGFNRELIHRLAQKVREEESAERKAAADDLILAQIRGQVPVE